MPQHKGEKNKIKQIDLESALTRAEWSSASSHPGAVIYLDVAYRHVRKGSRIQVALSDGAGKTFPPVVSTASGDGTRVGLTVPAQAAGILAAQVELPQYKLKKATGNLLLLGRVTISNVKWSKSEVRRGETLTLSADVRGNILPALSGLPGPPEATVTILEHDADGAHDLVSTFLVPVKQERIEARWDFEYQDDSDDIPTQEESERGYSSPEYFFRVEIDGVTAQSDLVVFKDWIEIAVKDHAGVAAEGESYVLKFPDGTQREGKVDGTGVIKVDKAPPGPYEIEFPDIDL